MILIVSKFIIKFISVKFIKNIKIITLIANIIPPDIRTGFYEIFLYYQDCLLALNT